MYRPIAIATSSISVIATILALLVLAHRAVPVQAATANAPRCSNTQLFIRPFTGGAAVGHHEVIYRIHNLAGNPCSLDGYPGVELLDRHFHSLPTHVTRNSGYIISGVPVRTVVLDRRHDAYFGLEDQDIPTGNEPCPDAPYILITPPNDALPVVTYSGAGAPCGGRVNISPVASNPKLR